MRLGQRFIQQPVQRAVVTAALLLSFASAAEAQLPTVQQVYDKYATAVGGRDAWSKVGERAEFGSADITFAGITGSYERYQSAPDKMRMIIDLGMGKVDQGTDGKVAWQGQPDGSFVKMSDDDTKYLIESLGSGASFLDPSRFKQATVAGQEDFDGVACYKVTITTAAGRQRSDFFEVATGLRRGQIVAAPTGEQKTAFRDYKAFENKLIPTKLILSSPQGDIVLTVAKASFSPNDPKTFDVPAGVAK